MGLELSRGTIEVVGFLAPTEGEEGGGRENDEEGAGCEDEDWSLVAEFEARVGGEYDSTSSVAGGGCGLSNREADFGGGGGCLVVEEGAGAGGRMGLLTGSEGGGGEGRSNRCCCCCCCCGGGGGCRDTMSGGCREDAD